MKLSALTTVRLVGAVAIGCALGLWYSNRSTPDIVPQARAATEPATREELDRLLKDRYTTAKGLLEMEEKRLGQGVTTLGHVCEVARWVRDSALELPVRPQERVRALSEYVNLTRRLEASVNRATTQGAASPADRESARYLRLDAEIMLLKVQLQ